VTGPVEELLRELAPRVLGALVRRNGAFDACEDAVQEALLAAATTWPTDGPPTNPTGWLITTASRRLIETWRSEFARRRREQSDALRAPPPAGPVPATDDTLALLVLCCHPALTPPSQVALTLRAVGGLSTAEIARALLIPEATVAQRISRVKVRKLKVISPSSWEKCRSPRIVLGKRSGPRWAFTVSGPLRPGDRDQPGRLPGRVRQLALDLLCQRAHRDFGCHRRGAGAPPFPW
jgi:RNA polymerase sigma factor (sigma-70 family)